ncbi:hypothetical protein D3C81_1897410 [compost metagenome]
MLEQQPPNLITQRRTAPQVALSDSMHRLHRQGLRSFHRYGMDGGIASGAQDRLGIVAIVLGTAAVFGDPLCRQQAHLTTHGLHLPRPGLGARPGLQQDRRPLG